MTSSCPVAALVLLLSAMLPCVRIAVADEESSAATLEAEERLRGRSGPDGFLAGARWLAEQGPADRRAYVALLEGLPQMPAPIREQVAALMSTRRASLEPLLIELLGGNGVGSEDGKKRALELLRNMSAWSGELLAAVFRVQASPCSSLAGLATDVARVLPPTESWHAKDALELGEAALRSTDAEFPFFMSGLAAARAVDALPGSTLELLVTRAVLSDEVVAATEAARLCGVLRASTRTAGTLVVVGHAMSRMARDKRPGVRMAAGQALLTGPLAPEEMPLLMELVEDSDIAVSSTLVSELMSGSEGRLMEFIRLLSPEGRPRRAAEVMLVQLARDRDWIPSQSVSRELKALSTTVNDSRLRLALLATLARGGQVRPGTEVRTLLLEAEGDSQVLAVQLCGSLETWPDEHMDVVSGVLTEALRSKVGGMPFEGLRALLNWRSPIRFCAALEHLFNEGDWSERTLAACLLLRSDCGDCSSAIAYVAGELRSALPPRRRVAVNGLRGGGLNARPLVAALEEALDLEASPEQRGKIERLLTEIRFAR